MQLLKEIYKITFKIFHLTKRDMVAVRFGIKTEKANMLLALKYLKAIKMLHGSIFFFMTRKTNALKS